MYGLDQEKTLQQFLNQLKGIDTYTSTSLQSATSTSIMSQYTGESRLWDCFGSDTTVGDVFKCCDFRCNSVFSESIINQQRQSFNQRCKKLSDYSKTISADITVQDFVEYYLQCTNELEQYSLTVNPEKLSKYVNEKNQAAMNAALQ